MLAVDAGPVAGATVALGAEVTAECGVGDGCRSGLGRGRHLAVPWGRHSPTATRRFAPPKSQHSSSPERPTQKQDCHSQRRCTGNRGEWALSLKRFSTSQFSQRAWSLAETLRQNSNRSHITSSDTGGPAPTGEALARRPRVRRSYAAIRASAGCRGESRSVAASRRSLRQRPRAGSRPSAGGRRRLRAAGRRARRPAGGCRSTRREPGKAATQHDRGRECR